MIAYLLVMASRDDVNAFLLRLKRIVVAGDLNFVPRNLSDIAQIGITFSQVEDELLALSPADYCQGPEDDHDGSSGAIWVFGIAIGSQAIYIKLKLDGDDARLISFHQARFSLSFPLR